MAKEEQKPLTSEQLAANFALQCDKNTSTIAMLKYDFNGSVSLSTNGPIIELVYLHKFLGLHIDKMLNKIIQIETTPMELTKNDRKTD